MKRQPKKVKPFFWDKMNKAVIQSTVWSDMPPSVQPDLNDLVPMFSVSNEDSKLLKSSSTPGQARKQKTITVLAVTRANNIAIMLSGIKVAFSDIRKALLELNDDNLTFDNLISISRQLPTSEEIARLKNYEDITRLTKADQYFSQIMSIPSLSQRLESMLYRRKFDIDVKEIRRELCILRDASLELRASARFKDVLQIVLFMGNTLNESTYRGGACGFKLGALLKLRETKTVKGGKDCPTLLHYLTRVLLRDNPALITFVEDLPNLESAIRVSFQTVVQNVDALVIGLSKIQTEVQHVRTSQTLEQGDQFVAVMKVRLDPGYEQ